MTELVFSLIVDIGMVYTIDTFNTLLPQPGQTKVISNVLMTQPKKPQVTPYTIAFVYLNIYHVKLVEKEQDDMVIMTTNKNVYTNLIKTKNKNSISGLQSSIQRSNTSNTTN